MATPLENAIARRDAILNEMAAFPSSVAAPDYSIDGVSVSRDAYRRALLEELKALNELIVQLNGPFMLPQQLRAR